jgi:two-component system chemotaxis response regulator CheB
VSDSSSLFAFGPSVGVAYEDDAVIGVVLTGYLDDGAAGLMPIKHCGGTCVVQNPEDAAFPDMPKNALAHVKVHDVVPLAEMGALLMGLLTKPLRPSRCRLTSPSRRESPGAC